MVVFDSDVLAAIFDGADWHPVLKGAQEGNVF